jgi:hypothetical protein
MNAGPWRLDHLPRFGLRAGSDLRRTLLRVLTELYLQKPTHTVDEERHYSELALRLLDGVDAGTRAAVAERLARFTSPPQRVMERLAADLPGIAAHVHDFALRCQLGAAALTHSITAAAQIEGEVASELNERFFAANADERRLILLNLELIAPFPAGRVNLAPAPSIGERLEAAVLSRNGEAFAQQMAQALQISRAQAQRLAKDDLGEPIVTVAKALNIGRAVLYRILLFVNMRAGASVARVRALAELHRQLPMRAAEQMVAIWQSLPNTDRTTERHRPLLWDDKKTVQSRAASSLSRPAEAAQRLGSRRPDALRHEIA